MKQTNSDKQAAGKEEILIYPRLEAQCSLAIVVPLERPHVPTGPGAASPAHESAPATAALPAGRGPEFMFLC